MKGATRRRVDRRGGIAGQHDALAGTLRIGIGKRNGADERTRVGVLRVFDDVDGPSELDDFLRG